MNIWYYPILISFLGGILCLIIPRRLNLFVKAVAIVGSVLVFAFIIRFFNYESADEYIFKDGLSSFILLAIGFFGVITVLYSLKYMSAHKRQNEFYALILMTISGAIAAVIANDLRILIVAWGFLAITLYLLVAIGSGEESAYAAKKTLIIVGGIDAVMLMGVLIIRFLSKSWNMTEISLSPIPLINTINGATAVSAVATIGFLFLVLGCLAKAGAFPLHTWIPDMAATSPAPVTAFLPASLDKLLGIYLLVRVSRQFFAITPAWNIFLMIIGAVTILGAVMMAMIQHDLRKLLGYHAVSQVGYMVLGVGTGNIIGIAGALLHMLNHSIYKSCLFLCGGAVEYKTGTNELEKLGGLAKYMPITFISCLIAALSISGIPPLNGFFSKWMIYQGVIDLGKTGSISWVLWIVAAMFGSALTLASFVKLIHAIFLGQKRAEQKAIREVNILMWIPVSVLAILCIAFGIFAQILPIKYFIQPAMSSISNEVVKINYTGLWTAGLATLMLLVGMTLGILIYLLGNTKGFRRDTAYIGGEILADETRVTGVDFYGTVKDIPVLRQIYALAEKKTFDIYEQGKKLTFSISDRLKEAHTGILRTYLAWCLLGLLILLIILMMKV